MKKFKTLVVAVLVIAIISSFCNVFAATTGFESLSGGYLGYYLDDTTNAVADENGVLTVAQNADKIYEYPVVAGNLFGNSGFEATTDSVDSSRLDPWNELTSGWASGSEIRNTRIDIKVVNDAHSGKNAFRLERVSSEKDPNSVTAKPGVHLYSFENVKNSIGDLDSENLYRDGTITGLEEGTEYILSYWVKGTADTRIQYRYDPTVGDAYTVPATNFADEATQDKWELVTTTLTADSVGIWANVYFNSANEIGTYAIFDDIQLMKKSDAVAMVEGMIADLDVTSPTVLQAIDDIEQWCAKLGVSNISNYTDFESKKKEYSSLGNYEYINDGNFFANSSFELSDTAVNSSNYSELTTGWVDVINGTQTKVGFGIDTEDPHSGNNSLAVTTINDQPRIMGSAYKDTDWTIEVDPTQKYTVSYWAKGAEFVRVIYWTYNSDELKWNSASWSVKTADAVAPGDDWKLFTFEFGADEISTYNGKNVVRMAIHFNGSSSNTMHIDDIMFATTEQTIANVEAMIQNLDANSPNYERMVEDIDQWCNELGSDKISNYDLYLQKVSGKYVYYSNANIAANGGFELSDAENVTYGWKAVANSTAYTASVSSDAHSGNNAINYVGSTGELSLINTATTNDYTYVSSDEEYIVSVWTKGGTAARIMTYPYKDGAFSTSTTRVGDRVEMADWKLVAAKLTPGLIPDTEQYAIKWKISVNALNTDANVMVDDVLVMKTSEAKSMVTDMIAKLDVNSVNYERALEDVNQWVKFLKDSDVTSAYETKLAECQAITEGMTNIITPDIEIGVGDYLASVTLKGTGEVGLMFHNMGYNATLTDEWVTYSEPISVIEGEDAVFGVQLGDTTDVTITYIKDFSLVELAVGDVNLDGKVDARDVVMLKKILVKVYEETVRSDVDGNGNHDSADLLALRQELLDK